MRLAGLFCIDSFAGGLLVNAILALWLFKRFGLSLGAAGQFFFWSGLLMTASQLLAPVLARRFGLVNTMTFTHIPASLFLIAASVAPTLPIALACLLLRSVLSSMDVPARNAFVMAVVTPPERAEVGRQQHRDVAVGEAAQHPAGQQPDRGGLDAGRQPPGGSSHGADCGVVGRRDAPIARLTDRITPAAGALP